MYEDEGLERNYIWFGSLQEGMVQGSYLSPPDWMLFSKILSKEI
jgi:hypothetical protein